MWKNRIVGEGEQPASQFIAHPNNWRVHPQHQRDAMRGALNEVGWVQRVIVNRRTGYLVDGHERVWEALQNNDSNVPYVEVDLSEEEEAYVLATLDPIGAMAQADAERVDELLKEVKTQEAGIDALLERMKLEAGLKKFNPEEEWEGMPEFEQEDEMPYRTIYVHFENDDAAEEFAALIGQSITDKTKYLWYPEQKRADRTGKGYVSE